MCEGSDKGLRFFSSPCDVSYLEHPGPRGTILTATTDAYRIVQRNPRGDTIAVFQGTTPTLPIGDAEWDSVTVELSNYLARDPAAKCNTRTRTRPSHKPAIRAFFWSSDGRLCVERYDSAGFAFDVFDERGTLLATLKAPDRVAEIEPHVSENLLALVTVSPEGAHIVRGYAIGH